MNIKCFLFGRDYEFLDCSVVICERCHSADDPYGSGEQWTEFEWEGIAGKLKSFWYKTTAPVRKHITRKCEQCGKRIWRVRYTEDFCSKECHDEWIPF